MPFAPNSPSTGLMNMDYKEKGLPEWIIFDLDNTLYPYKPAHDAGMAALTKKLSTFFSESEIEPLYNQAREAVKKRLGPIASSHSRLLYIKEMFDTANLGHQVEFILEAESIYWDSYLDNMKLFDGVLEFLADLKSKGVTCYLVTDLTTSIQLRKINKLGLANYFAGIVTSEEAGGDKETKLPFTMLIKKYNLNYMSYCWSIGDAPCDIKVPKETFINCLGFEIDKNGTLFKGLLG